MPWVSNKFYVLKEATLFNKKKFIMVYQSVIEALKTSRLFKPRSTIHGGRYHSLKLQEPFKTATIDITMRCKNTNVAMALEDQTNQVLWVSISS